MTTLYQGRHFKRIGSIGYIFIIVCLYSVYIGTALASKYSHQPEICNPPELNNQNGIIRSPNYPVLYPNHTSCTWVINAPPEGVVKISMIDFDIEEDVNCGFPPCCTHTWLSLPKDGGGDTKQYCGLHRPPSVISVPQVKTNIKFHTSKVVRGGRGFMLNYTVTLVSPCSGPDEIPCMDEEARCFNNVTERCNGEMECMSGSDEKDCVKCGPGEYACRSEKSCDGKTACVNGDGCYTASEHCNSVQNCGDNSDEADCGDSNDEQSCIKVSIITAAIIGSLICGLLLVIAVGCMCRLYSLRLAVSNNYRIQHDEVSHVSSGLRSVPHPEDFFHREPPPAYTVTVGECQQLQRVTPPGCRAFTFAPSEHHISNMRHHHSNRRSTRRYSNGRRRSQRNSIGSSASPTGADLVLPGTDQSRHRSPHCPGFPPLHSLVCTPSIPVSTTLETSLAAQHRESMIVSDHGANENKSMNSNHNTIPTSSALSMASREERDLLTPVEFYDTCLVDIQQEPEARDEGRYSSPLFSSSSTSTSESPSRESVTSSTSLLSYLSSNDDTQLLVVPPQ
ncbi:low-density lipoprotein receptor-related protein 3-like isoform X2 [Zootermopsis nevadensis]|uniref:low-density lipoprotein receptor-related protein 3-like isoform X2 n=1 Tax=Zootermopsis nevadensis TaxID=136037 RepID=UPI000B8E443D|nr:low-density lipoprotein receptor-related protein 3-like isoform X2 [Zootermopsis nevadensis]